MSRPFKGTITMPANTNAQRLSDLLKAVVGTGGDAGCSTRYRSWTIIADQANTGSLYIGGAGVASTNYGVILAATDSWTVGEGNMLNNETAEAYWIRGSANSQILHFDGRIA